MEIESGYKGNVDLWKEAFSCWGKQIGHAGEIINKNLADNGTAKLDTIYSRYSDLPKSYLDFVIAGGAGLKTLQDIEYPHEDYIPRFFNPENVGYFNENHKEDYEIWTDDPLDDELNEEYFQYNNAGAWLYRTSEFIAMLAVGWEQNGGLYLLNPTHKTIDGEWEAGLLHPKIPGIIRFKSFAHLVAQLYIENLNEMNHSAQRGLYSFEDNWDKTCFSKIIVKDW